MSELTIQYDDIIIFHGDVDVFDSELTRDKLSLSAEFKPRSFLDTMVAHSGPSRHLSAVRASEES